MKPGVDRGGHRRAAEVEADAPLFDLYSRELYEAQEEYLLEYRNRDRVPIAVPPDLSSASPGLLESARIRLEYYDISPEQIETLETSGVPSKTMTIHSPYKGVVIAKHANEGMHVDPGMQVFRIADLSKVWVMVTRLMKPDTRTSTSVCASGHAPIRLPSSSRASSLPPSGTIT